MADYTLYTAKITTLTPLHIGNGRDLLNEYDYAIQGGQTWRIDEAALLEAQNVADPRQAEMLARTPPRQLLQEPDFRPDSPLFRYVIRGTPRATGAGAQVREQLKDIHDRPYLPGSSLKGALRTVLAWNLWAAHSLTPDPARLNRRREWAAQEYERQLFGRDPNHDLLRALQVGDSAPLDASRLMLMNARVIGRGGHLGSPIELEAIRQETTLTLRLKIDRWLLAVRGSDALGTPGDGRWLEQLPQAVAAYNADRWQAEQAWFARIPGADRLAGFYGKLHGLRLKPNAFIVQVGWGAGWDGKTLGSRLKGTPAFMERIIDDYRLARGSRKAGDPFPKSRRVAVSLQPAADGTRAETPAAPLGWVAVELEAAG